MVVEEDRLDLPDPLPLDLHVLFARRPLRRLPGLREHRSVATSRCLHFAEKPRSITPSVIRSLVLLLAAAAVEAILDLAYKAHSISEQGGAVLAHDRSAPYVVGVAGASLVWAGAVALTRSPSIALAGGVVLGGAVGNLASIALWPGDNERRRTLRLDHRALQRFLRARVGSPLADDLASEIRDRVPSASE
jgi:hypothetical protein